MPTLQWLGRDEDIKAAYKTPYKLLKEIPENGYGDKDTGNMLIHGDNLEALKALLPFYAGQVKCIYIDPPYNTGARIDADGKEVGYDDNLEHSIWLSMMYPRLLLLKELLSQDGILAIQIDDHEIAHLLMLLSEIFGTKNLKIIAVKMSEATSLKMASIKRNNTIPKLKEFIILASKQKIKNLNIDMIPKEKWDNEYKYLVCGVSKEEIDFLKYVLVSDEITPEDFIKGDEIASKIYLEPIDKLINGLNKKDAEKKKYENAWRIVRDVAVTENIKEIANKKRKLLCDSCGSFIIKTKQNKKYLIKKQYNEDTAQPRCKLLFADFYLTVHPGDFWSDIKTTGLGNEGGVVFKKGKKPEALIERIIKLKTNTKDIVLDSFLGSGTTAAVAQKMGRRFIGIEIGQHAYTHCLPRLKAVTDGEQGGISKTVNWQGGGGFRFYELGDEVFDGDGKINPNITFEQLAAHIWFAETKTPFNPPEQKSTFLGVHKGTAYALLFNGILHDKSVSGGNVLTNKTLQIVLSDIKAPYDKLVVFGEACRLGNDTLNARNIEFRQTPYDIKAR